MPRSLPPILSAFFISLAVTATVFAAPATPAPVSQSLTGSIVSVSSSGLVLDVGGNQVQVVPAQGALILGRHAATFADIKPGDAMGVAATKGADGSLTATSINIFSASLWKMAQKGQWLMSNGQTMTNAVVTTSMVVQAQGGTVSLSYQEVSAKISVPPTADIHRLVDGALTDLKPGMKITVRGSPDANGGFTATSLTFDVEG